MAKKLTLKDLEKRIKVLEERPLYVQPIYQKQVWICPICGGNGGCMHVTCGGTIT